MVSLIVLEGADLIDGTGKLVKDARVLVDGSKIAGAGPSGEVKVPAGKHLTVDLSEMMILPGLIDLHAHLHGQADPTTQDSLINETDAYQAVLLAENAHRTIEAGFTTIKDMGAPNDVNIDLSRAVNDGVLKGPRIIPVATVDMTGAPGGYDVHGTRGGEASGPIETRRAARMKIAMGAEVVQVKATGAGYGKFGPKVLILSVEEMKAAVEETHKLGKRTTAHACGSEGIKNAVISGVQCIEHGQWLYEDDELIEMVVEKRVGWVPTLMNNYIKLKIMNEATKKGEKSGLPRYVEERVQYMVEPHRKSFEKAMKAGVLVGMGTDVGAPYTPNGMNAYEMEMFVKYGATPMQAIEAATRVNSQILRMEDKFGTIERGKEADLIVVKKNPLRDIRVLQEKHNIALVMKGGETLVDRLGIMGSHSGLM
ncbi:MAG: amidohydrolase family protein [Thaumarchaeota archaeon]|nr:amidohydrolase family protein [Nitrososphaerota archaeon]